MPLFKKSILRVGTYHSPDGKVQITPERLRHWAAMHRKLRQNRQVVPIDWDHADNPTTAVPMSAKRFNERKRSAKNTVGHLRGFRVARDGQSAEIVLDLHRKSAVEAADSNTVFVSPVIFDEWKDGSGNVYDDVITHVDFVNHPVDATQGAFEQVAEGTLALALRFGLGEGKPNIYRLELDIEDDDEDEEDDEDVVPVDDEDEDEGEEDADAADDEPPVDNGEDDTAVADDDFIPDQPPTSEDDVVEMGDDSPVMPAVSGVEDTQLAAQIAADLEAAGIAAPSGVDPIGQAKEFLGQLCAALRQKAMDANADSGDDEEDDDLLGDDDFGGDDDMADTSAGGGLMETSPEFAAMSLRLKKAEERSMAAEQRLLTMARSSKLASLKSLLKTGRITANEFNTHSASLKTIKMSLNKDGEPKRTTLDTFIAARAKVPAGAMWPNDSELRMSIVTSEPGEEITGVVTPTEARKFVDEQAKRMGGMIKPS